MTPKEALIRLHNQATRYFKPNDEKDQILNKRFKKYKSIIEQALTELEETKILCESFKKDAIRLNEQGIDLYLKYKKQNQILEVLKNKRVDIDLVNKVDSAKSYNCYCREYDNELTETEFILIKEWLNETKRSL